MARLPQPGGDVGTWGAILNDFLIQAHNTDGTLKDTGIVAAKYTQPAGGIPSSDLSSAVQASLAKANSDPTALAQLTDVNVAGVTNTQVLSFDSGTSKWIPATVSGSAVSDATTGSKGIVQLAGDLAGTAALPTVPTKVDKATLTAKGDILTATASATPAKVSVGTNGQILTADSTQATGIKWAAAPSAPVTSVNSQTGAVVLAKADVGLGNVDNTSDANKPVSTATSTALGGKVDKSTLTTKGDLLTATAASTPVSLGVGSDGQILTADSSQSSGIKWATAAAGFSDPTTTKGDIIIHGASTTRLGIGSDGQVLTADSTQATGAKWSTPASSPISSVFTRTGAVTAQTGDYTAAQVTNAADKSSGSTQTFTASLSAAALSAAGITGATASSRYVGATANGAPSTGAFLVGDFAIDQTGKIWVCTVAGSPGTWVSVTPTIDTDGTLAANSDSRVASQKAVKTYVDGAVVSGAPDATASTKGKVQLAGDFGGTAASPQVVATHLSSALPVNQGGTGSTSQNFVDLSTTQSTIAGAKTFTSNLTAPAIIASGLTGATAASRYAGATASGAPASGTFVTGDFVIDQTGTLWVCSSGGSPGTWKSAPVDANLVHTSGNETIGGTKTFSSLITGSISGNAATVTTNANLTGDVTSVGNATTIAANAVTNAKAAQMAANTIKGNNTGSTANAADLTAAQVKALLAIGEGDVTNLTTDLAAKQAKLVPTAVKTANYTAAAYDLVPCDTSSGAFTITLPTAPAQGTLVGVKMVTQGSNYTITINTAGSDVINKAGGVTTASLTLLAQAYTFEYNASNSVWYIVNDDLPLGQLDLRYTASSSKNQPILQTYWDALNADTATTVFLGDSITYGYLVSQNKAYPEQFQSIVTQRFGGTYTNWTPPAPGASNEYGDSSRGVTFTGTPVVLASGVNGCGLGSGAMGYQALGQSNTFTTNRATTSIGFWYMKGPNFGNVKVTVDGGAPVTFDQGAASLSAGNVYQVTGLSSGIHTIKVEGATGGLFQSGYAANCEAFIFDTAAKPRIFNAARKGAQTIHFNQSANPHWQDGLTANPPNVVMIYLGTNDITAGLTQAQTKANLQEIITTLNALATPPSAILLGTMPKNSTNASVWQGYYNDILALVAANHNVLLWDIAQVIGDNTAGNYPSVFGAGGVHFNAYGHTLVANSVASLILPPYVQDARTRQIASSTGIAGMSDWANTATGDSWGDLMLAPSGLAGSFDRIAMGTIGKVMMSINVLGLGNPGPAWSWPVPATTTITVAGSTYTINTDTTSMALIVNPAADFTVTTSGATPQDGQKLRVRITSGATPRVPTWNAIFLSSGLVSLPTSFTASKTTSMGFEYDATAAKWVLMALDPVGY